MDKLIGSTILIMNTYPEGKPPTVKALVTVSLQGDGPEDSLIVNATEERERWGSDDGDGAEGTLSGLVARRMAEWSRQEELSLDAYQVGQLLVQLGDLD